MPYRCYLVFGGGAPFIFDLVSLVLLTTASCCFTPYIYNVEVEVNCLSRKIAKKWLGRHNVTIAIDSITLEKKVSDRIFHYRSDTFLPCVQCKTLINNINLLKYFVPTIDENKYFNPTECFFIRLVTVSSD